MIYVDSNVVIRLMEGDAVTRGPLESRLHSHRSVGPFLLTSRLTRMECRVKPVREGNANLLALYEEFFASPEIQLVELTADIIERATEIRANLNLKTPDAIHLASAIQASATTFLTGDHELAKCKQVTVEVL